MGFGVAFPPGHEHAGKARTRKANCIAMEYGSACNREFTQFRQDPEFGAAANPEARELYFKTACHQDEQGGYWFPKFCPRCERRRLSEG
jgi:hypothetical protein